MDGGGALQEGDAFFKRSRFTLYANVKFDAAHDNTSALLVGSDAGANFRIVPCKTDGTAVLKVNNGTEHKLSKAMTAGEWNALALVYAENDTEGTVAVYLNGEEVLPATGIGFKLSEKSGIVGAVGATFGTGFMRTGLYDELVVTGAADAEAAKVETAARKAAADAVVAVDGVVTVTGAEVEQAAQNVNGWTYKGLGMLNGNSTSNLLLDYKAESPDAYWAMMRYLFGGDYPLFSNIKMEMGNDGNNSTGAEACTMRYEDEEAGALLRRAPAPPAGARRHERRGSARPAGRGTLPLRRAGRLQHSAELRYHQGRVPGPPRQAAASRCPQSADRRPAYLSAGPAGRGRGHHPFPAKPYRGRTQRHLRHGKVYR